MKVTPDVAKIWTKTILVMAFVNELAYGAHVELFRLVSLFRFHLIVNTETFYSDSLFTFALYLFFRLLFFILLLVYYFIKILYLIIYIYYQNNIFLLQN